MPLTLTPATVGSVSGSVVAPSPVSGAAAVEATPAIGAAVLASWNVLLCSDSLPCSDSLVCCELGGVTPDGKTAMMITPATVN